jgi:prephenate dehydrogenase
MPIRQLTIVGTGLIGGSFGLALKHAGFKGTIAGCDRADVLERAQQMRAIDRGSTDARAACAGSDVVLLALPVGAIIDFIERYGPLLGNGTLLTDVGSTKNDLAARARAVFGDQAAERFLPGHPMAGKEHSGIEHAVADLFRGSVWLITPLSDRCTDQQSAFLGLVAATGARVETLALDHHDRLCAWVSHLPQMISTALAATLEEEFGDDPLLRRVGGRALREMTRIAASPYSMWRDIALTNDGNIAEALLRLEQRLAHLRENLRARELADEFEKAGRFSRRGTESQRKT